MLFCMITATLANVYMQFSNYRAEWMFGSLCVSLCVFSTHSQKHEKAANLPTDVKSGWVLSNLPASGMWRQSDRRSVSSCCSPTASTLSAPLLIVAILNLKQLKTFNLMSHWCCQCEACLFSHMVSLQMRTLRRHPRDPVAVCLHTYSSNMYE